MFWWFILACDILIPVLMIIIGILMKYIPPKKINSFIGYRTARSMKNIEAWNYAQKYTGKLMLIIGVLSLIPSIVIHIPFYNEGDDFLGNLSIIVVVIQLTLLIANIIIVEFELKNKFKD